MYGTDSAWTLDRQLMAAVVDLTALGNWQRGGGKRKDKPKPIERPGASKVKRVGDASKLSPKQARALLDSLKQKELPDGS